MTALASLLDSRLVLVTGKGGTGKSTLAAALAALGAAQGKRTLLAEVDIARPAMRAVFDVVPDAEPLRVRDGLDLVNLLHGPSLQAFLEDLVPVRRVVRMILGNPVVSRFLDFTPGAREMVTLARLVHFAERYDLVVVDLPASGHAFSLLDLPRSALGLFRTGPMRTRAQRIRTVLEDPSTRVVFVALPEQMVVNETLETEQRFGAFGLLAASPTVILNRASLPTLTDAERELLHRLSERVTDGRGAEFVQAGRWEDRLEQATERALDRLSEHFTQPVLVPPALGGGAPRDVVAEVSVHLGRQVGVTRRDLDW